MVAQEGHVYSMASFLNRGELMPFDGFGGSVGISHYYYKTQQPTVG